MIRIIMSYNFPLSLFCTLFSYIIDVRKSSKPQICDKSEHRIQVTPHARTITVALDMSKAFDTVNIHILTIMLKRIYIYIYIYNDIRNTIIKFIENYIKEHTVYTTLRKHTSTQRQFKTGHHQGDIISPRLFNIYTSDMISMEIIFPSRNVHDLGIYMFDDCTFNFHISSLSRKCANFSGWILSTFYTRDCITLLTLFK